jgi:HPt (histidine-containing phosphotransfer) domain-containing protein
MSILIFTGLFLIVGLLAVSFASSLKKIKELNTALEALRKEAEDAKANLEKVYALSTVILNRTNDILDASKVEMRKAELACQSQALFETAPDMQQKRKQKDDRDAEFLREIPLEGIDFEAARNRFSNEVVYLNSLQSYILHTPPVLAALKDPKVEKLKSYIINVHGIKGSSYGVAVETIGHRAEELEKAAKAGDFAYVSANTNEFVAQAEKIIADLQHVLEKKGQKPLKEAPDRNILQKIHDAASAYNIGELDEALGELEKYSYESNGDLIFWLREHIEISEFEAISEKLWNWLKLP